MPGLAKRFSNAIEGVINWFFNDLLNGFTDITLWDEIFELSTETPAPDVKHLFATPSNSLWNSLYTYNDAIAVISLIFVFLNIGFLIFGNSIGGVSGYDKKQGLYGSFISIFLIVFNKEFMAMGLNASSALSTTLAPSVSSAEQLWLEITLISFIPVVGAIIAIFFTFVQMFALALVMVRDLLIFMLFIAMPLLLAFKPLNVGPLEKFGRIANSGIGTFVGLLAFTFPISASWKIGLMLQETSYFKVLGAFSQTIFAAVVICFGILLGLKATKLGNTVYTKASSAAETGTTIAAAYGTGGASLAAATAVKGGNKHQGQNLLDKAAGNKQAYGKVKNKVSSSLGTSNKQTVGSPGNARAETVGISDFTENTDEPETETQETTSTTTRRTQAANWMTERYQNGKSYMRQTAASTPALGGGNSSPDMATADDTDNVEFLYSDYDQTSTHSGNKSATSSENHHSRGTNARVIETNENTNSDAEKVAPEPAAGSTTSESKPTPASSLTDDQLAEITSEDSNNQSSDETTPTGQIENGFPDNR